MAKKLLKEKLMVSLEYLDGDIDKVGPPWKLLIWQFQHFPAMYEYRIIDRWNLGYSWLCVNLDSKDPTDWFITVDFERPTHIIEIREMEKGLTFLKRYWNYVNLSEVDDNKYIYYLNLDHVGGDWVLNPVPPDDFVIA